MVFNNMVTLSEHRSSYNFIAQVDNFTFNGNCQYDDDNLLEINCSASIPEENPEVEGNMIEVGTFNYSFYLVDRVNYSFYIEGSLVQDYFSALLTLVEELKEAKNKTE